MSNQFPNKPDSIKIKQSSNEITIITKWSEGPALLYTIIYFLLFLFSILIPIYSFRTLLNGEGELLSFLFMTLFSIVISIPFLFIGITILYYLISIWINRTYIFVNKDAINIRSKPLPWRDNTDFRVDKLEKIYLKKIAKAKVGDEEEEGGKLEKNNFRLRAKMKNDADKNIIKVYNYEEALFIEQTLKDYLNLEDDL